MWIFVDNFLETIFRFQVFMFSSSYIVKCCSISPDIVKYRSTEISKVFYKYRQISFEFMTNSIEIQMLSKYAASEKRTKVSRTSLVRALSFRTY